MATQDPNIFGPFARASFQGATVSSFTITANWSDQPTYLNLTVVEDPNNNDYFLLKDGEPQYDQGDWIGRPFQFTYGGFTYGGLLKSVEESRSIDGYPLYHVTLTTPVEVLDAAQVILAGYVGVNSDIIFNGGVQPVATFSVSNLINAYGWMENGGVDFGRSQITDIGLPWDGIYGLANAIQTLTNTPPAGVTTTNFGQYIIYKGIYYRVDLSNLPVPPSYYRLGGAVSMTLLEVIQRYMQDGGLDYMIRLTVDENRPQGPHTISFLTVPRYVQQPLGQIIQYINGQTYVSESSHGQELRSDITQAFLVGGPIQLLQPLQNNGVTLNILPFFGFDFNGFPIIGSKPDGTQYADDDLSMNLNATPVADLMSDIGLGLSYPCSILEMRCALGNYDTWAAYVKLNKPNLALSLNLYGAWELTNGPSAETVLDLMNTGLDYVTSLNNMFIDPHWPAVSQRLYEFVRGQAEVYYGKKFIIVLPFSIQVKVDPTTAEVSLSNELSDAGFLPEGSQPLGLNFVNENFFLDQTGRFYPFVRYSFYSTFNSVAGAKLVQPNVAYLKGSSAVVQYDPNPQNAYVYSRCEQGEDGPVSQNGLLSGGSQIFFITNGAGLSVPAMIVTVADAVWAQAEDFSGSITDLAAIMGTDPATLQSMTALRETSVNLQIHPPAYYPNGCAVALKSNQELYGPWGKFSQHGKLNFEQDEGLVPWEYGGYDLLTQVAIAKLNTIAMGNQVLERGTIKEAGIPKVSIGDLLVTDGPIVTSIECSISTNEVSTSYSMETFVNRIGAFTIENAERLRRIGKIYQQLRRTMRQQILNNIQRSNIMATNYQGFMYGTAYALEQHSPHGALAGRLIQGTGLNYIPSAWTVTHQQSLANLGLTNASTYQATACAGMETLLRPYSNDPGNAYLPVVYPPDPSWQTSQLISSSGTYSINPLQKGSDITWLLSGNDYVSPKVKDAQVDYATARSLALRGPVMICGWGYDLQGKPIPNQKQLDLSSVSGYVNLQLPLTGLNSNYINNYLQQSFQWPVGPLDITYDKFRGVWASPGMILEGINSGIMPGLGNGKSMMQVYINNQPTSELIPYDSWIGTAATGVKIQIGWNPLKKQWTLVSAAC